MHDPLEALRIAGCPVDLLSSAQRAVLASLSPQETAVLVTVQERLREAEGEVVAHNLKML
ncbi:aroma-sacti cluster domain-containing protein [Actinoplanes sp. NPDC051475]|uniref:aroma-sacti cluster domain-containing protein n=1 Tax=Actinoplanes sp. NPDC051475 TaxID=3157225 RepID=UPI00344FB198